MSKVGFIGLGTMGAPMAGHLINAGHAVTVWNRTSAKAEPLKAKGAQAAADLKGFKDCDFVMLCVGRSEDVEDVVTHLSGNLKPGCIVVDHSTIEPKVAQKLQQTLHQQGVGFVDAPVTGGSMGAKNGALTIFCGGEEQDVKAALPIIQAYAKRAERVGGPGQGQMMKLANQIAVMGTLIGLCECMAFAKKAGLDLDLVHSMIGGGAGGSWAFENYGKKVLAEDWTPGFSVKNQRKDFGYCESVAQELGIEIAGTALTNQLLAKLDEAGCGEETTAALYKVYLNQV